MSLSPLLCNSLYKDLVKSCKNNGDLIIKHILIGGKTPAALLFTDGAVDSLTLSEQVVKQLCSPVFEDCPSHKMTDMIISCTSALNCERTFDIEKLKEKLSFGHGVLIHGKCREAVIFEARPKTVRSVSEPTSENITKGAKDCFTEQIKINLALIRNRLKTPSLQTEMIAVGKQSSTAVALVSIDGTVNPDCLKLARKRLKSLNIDSVDSIGVLEEALRDEDCLFPQNLVTERPDRACAHINEGCIAIIADGFPFVIIAPVSILHHLSTADDYTRHHLTASAIRIMRYFLMIVALILPGFYISVATYHQEMLPSLLATSIIRTRQSVPFNDIIETFVLLIAFEILVEAGLRMPKNIGQTVSIVGGLIVGDAAVNAQLISPVVVIIVAISVIATYTIPDQDFSSAIRLLRLILCTVCSFLGLAGLSLGFAAITVYICSSRSLGVPYMAPVTVTSPPTQDSFMRKEFSKDLERPQFLGTKNPVRRKDTKN